MYANQQAIRSKTLINRVWFWIWIHIIIYARPYIKASVQQQRQTQREIVQRLDSIPIPIQIQLIAIENWFILIEHDFWEENNSFSPDRHFSCFEIPVNAIWTNLKPNIIIVIRSDAFIVLCSKMPTTNKTIFILLIDFCKKTCDWERNRRMSGQKHRWHEKIKL